MASLLTRVSLAHLLPPSNTVYIGLFTDVVNGQFLREQLLAGNADFEYAFINCDTVVSTSHVLAACFRAVNDLQNNRLRSKNVHSEIVFSLGTNNNIATSLKAFGVDSATKHLLAVKVSNSEIEQQSQEESAIERHLTANVDGSPLPFTDASLAPLTDWSKVLKIYKLSDLGQQRSVKKLKQTDESKHSQDPDVQEAETAILGLIALRGS